MRFSQKGDRRFQNFLFNLGSYEYLASLESKIRRFPFFMFLIVKKQCVLSPIFLVVQIQLVGLLVGSLVGKPSFCFVWYDLPTNSLTNDLTNNRTNWIWTSKKIGLYLRFFSFFTAKIIDVRNLANVFDLNYHQASC